MALSPEIQKYIGIPYKFKHGPKEVQDLETAYRIGINCLGIVHLLRKDSGKPPFPPHMLSKEIYEDTKFFDSIGGDEEFETGDIFVFKRKTNGENPEQYHVAHYLGKNDDGQHTFIHASSFDKNKASSIWTLEEFLDIYELRLVKRPKREEKT